MSTELPAEIEKIREETKKLEDELFKGQVGNPTGESPTGPNAPPDGKTGEAPPDGPTGEAAPTGESPTGEAPPEPPPESQETPPKKSDDFKHKYEVMRGKYNKELPRERQAVKDARDRAIVLETENSQLRQDLTDVKSRLERLETGTKITPQPDVSLEQLESDPSISWLKNEMPDVFKAVKTFVQKSADATASSTKGKIEKVENEIKNISETTTKTAWQTFEGYLDDRIDGWREVNADPTFKAWLENTGRIDGIQRAINNLDAPRVTKFFVDFVKENSEPETPKETEPLETKKPAATLRKPADIVPPKGKIPPPPKRQGPDTEIITTEHVTKFYSDRHRGAYIGREDVMRAEEKRIEKAMLEGRIK